MLAKLLKSAALAAMILVFAAACGGTETAPETSNPTATPGAAPAQAEPTTETPMEPTTEPTAEPTAEPAAEAPAILDQLTDKTGNGWMWLSYTDAGGAVQEVAKPNKYTLVINTLDSVFASADCNFVEPRMTLDGEQMSLDVDLSNLAECSEGSLSRQYYEWLNQAESVAVAGDQMVITLRDGAGTLTFAPLDPLLPYRAGTWDEAMQNLLAECGAPGAVLLVDSAAGRYLQAYGVADTETGTPMRTSDRFEIGSNTKSFTAVLALLLQEDGVWSLDDPLSQWLPEQAARIPNGDVVTLRQLASNTSGIWDYADPLIGGLLEGGGDLAQGFTPEELIDYVVENGQPDFAPGEGAAYSSTNFILLGMALEAATGQKLADLYRTRIFDPLGMANTSLLEGVPAEGEIISGYYTLSSGETINATRENGSQMWAAGGIISTAEDMANFAGALLLGKLFNSPDSTTQLIAFGDKVVPPFLGYGLGVGKFSEEPFAWGHGGQTAGFQTTYLILPDNFAVVIVLSNSGSCHVGSIVNVLKASPNLLPAPLIGAPSFPQPEPDYDNKRPRDLTPFAAALDALTPERAAALDALLAGQTIPQLQVLLDGGQTSSAELVTYYVNRIRQYDIDRLNSVMELNPEAPAIAAALDAERAAGTVRGPLHGIPVLLKDNIATGDQMHTTAGAYALRDWRADRDAFLVQQLRAAGAVILGKANLSEWANYTDPSTPNGFSTLGGQTRHPYGPFDPLGSSTGSAVAVAANLATVSVGTETQGSIIQPAVVNSIVAIKTSRGLVSRDYIIPLVDWMDVPGPMGRSVTDVAILLTAMTGVDANDPATADAAPLAGTDFGQFAAPGAAEGKRVGLFIASDAAIESVIADYGLSGEAAQLYRDALAATNADWRALGERLTAAGVEVVEIDSSASPATPDPVPVLEYGFQQSVNQFLAGLGAPAPISALADVAAINDEDPANRVPYGQRYVTGSINTAITAEDYAATSAANEAAAVAALRQLFDTYNLDAFVSAGSQAYAAAGFPAITLPQGLNGEGQPTGVILVGDFLGEPDLIAIAYALEQASPGRVEPDLARTIEAIDAVVGGEGAGN